MTRHASPELGNVVFFDHVNLAVTDHRLATLFFIEGLGFTRDPYRMVGTRNMWVNVGTQQFHLPIGTPQPFAGEIGIAVPDVAATAASLEQVAPALADTDFAMSREDGTLRLSDPWGRPMRVLRAGSLPGRNPLALPYIEFTVRPGAAAGLAEFYREVLGAPATCTNGEGEVCAAIDVGPWQQVRYRESRTTAPTGHALHIAIYVSRFWELYERFRAMGLLMEDVANEQFRFRDMPALGGGEPLYAIEHEVRGLCHLDYRRPLVNRIPMPNEPGYTPPD